MGGAEAEVVALQRSSRGRSSVRRSSASPSSPESRQANHARQRDVITRLAEGIFAQRGFRGTTIRLVAAKARCSVGQIYKLFPSKLDLYRGILESRGEKLGALVDAISEEPTSVRARLERIVRALLVFFQENSSFFRIYMLEMEPRVLTTILHSRSTRLEKIHRHGLERLTALIREGQENGELRSDLDPMKATTVLFGMIKGQVSEQILFRKEGRLVEEADTIIKIFFRGMAGGSRA